jgi:MFS family permease
MSRVGDAPRTPRAAAIGVVTAAVAAVGAAIGVLWAQIAPPIHGVVALTHDGERVQAYLGNESEHFFVGPFLVLGLLGVLAVVSATLAWQWQAHRGPGMVAGLSIGLVAAAALSTLVGSQLVSRWYGAVKIDEAPVTPDHRVYYFTEAPPVFFGDTPLQVATTLLVPAGAAALGYALCAAWTTRDDLGGYPAFEAATEPAAPGAPPACGTPTPGAVPSSQPPDVTADGR